MKQINALRQIFSKKEYFVIFLVFLVGFGLLLSINAAIISIVDFSLNPLADIVTLFLVGLLALLMSLNIVVLIHNSNNSNNLSKTPTLVGFMLSLFVTACPVCLPIWLTILGMTVSFGFLTEISIYLLLFSLILLSAGLFLLLNCANGNCVVKRKKV